MIGHCFVSGRSYKWAGASSERWLSQIKMAKDVDWSLVFCLWSNEWAPRRSCSRGEEIMIPQPAAINRTSGGIKFMGQQPSPESRWDPMGHLGANRTSRVAVEMKQIDCDWPLICTLLAVGRRLSFNFPREYTEMNGLAAEKIQIRPLLPPLSFFVWWIIISRNYLWQTAFKCAPLNRCVLNFSSIKNFMAIMACFFSGGGKTAWQKYQPPSSATMVILREKCRWLGFIVSFKFEAMKEIWSQWNGDRFRRPCCSRFIASTCWAGQHESLAPASTGSKMLLQQIEA